MSLRTFLFASAMGNVDVIYLSVVTKIKPDTVVCVSPLEELVIVRWQVHSER